MDKFNIPPGYPGKCTPDTLRKFTDRIKDNPDFRERLANAVSRKDQRSFVSQALGADSYITNASDREQLRRFFCRYYGIANPPRKYDQCEGDKTLLFMENPPRWADTPQAKKVVINKVPSLKELIESKLGPYEPDAMQELHDAMLSEITTALGGSTTRDWFPPIETFDGKHPVTGSMTSAASNTVSKPFNLADVERFSIYMDEVASAPTRDWFLLDTPLIRGEFGRLDGVRLINASPSHQALKKETPVNTKPLTITTKTFTYVNGVDVNNYSASELYDMIAREEAKIRTLEAIDHKPVMLKQEITRRKDGIAALVAHLDGFDVVATPAPAPLTDSTQ